MKKALFAIAILAALLFGSCTNFGSTQTVEQNQEPTEVTVGEWTVVDSNTIHYNITDSACITMTVEDTGMCFECVGVDTFEMFQQVDSTTYSIPSENCGEGTWWVENESLVKDARRNLRIVLDSANVVELSLDF